MEQALGPLVALLIVSGALNVYWWRERKALRAKIQAKSTEPTYDCRELLHDLTAGAGLVKIVRINPLDVYIKRS